MRCKLFDVVDAKVMNSLKVIKTNNYVSLEGKSSGRVIKKCICTSGPTGCALEQSKYILCGIFFSYFVILLRASNCFT